jgi:hypothetical protein
MGAKSRSTSSLDIWTEKIWPSNNFITHASHPIKICYYYLSYY